jgi:hypothetical protein
MHVTRATPPKSPRPFHRYGGPRSGGQPGAVMIGGCANLPPT